MTSEWNILEDILKNQKPIDPQIQSAEEELAALDEKRKELQARIKQLKRQKQAIADKQLPFDRLSNKRQSENNEKREKTGICSKCEKKGVGDFGIFYYGEEISTTTTETRTATISSTSYKILGYKEVFICNTCG